MGAALLADPAPPGRIEQPPTARAVGRQGEVGEAMAAVEKKGVAVDGGSRSIPKAMP